MSTLHPDGVISVENDTKKKPETDLFYIKTKAEVDVVDQMTRKYSIKAASRRWPVHFFYNVIDFAIINSWVLYQEICRSRISRREYMQCVAEELCGISPNNQSDELVEMELEPQTKMRRTSSTSKCRNRMTLICHKYKEAICGKYSTKVCQITERSIYIYIYIYIKLQKPQKRFY